MNLSCPMPPDAEEITRLSTALSKISQKGTDGRVYGGDPMLVHVQDSKRKAAGDVMASVLSKFMRSEAVRTGARTREQVYGTGYNDEQALCPGCYMVVAFDMLVALAQRNGQSLTELARTMSAAFDELARSSDNPYREEINVIMDPEDLPADAPNVAADPWNLDSATVEEAIQESQFGPFN